MKTSLYSILFGMLLAGVAEARDIYVDNVAGSDRYTGEQLKNALPDKGPVKTITKALKLAMTSDRIILLKNDIPYHESITISGSRCSGTESNPLVIEGNGAILDGSSPVPASGWKNFRGAVFCFRPPRMAYQQLFLDGRPAPRVSAGNLSKEVPELKPRQWCSVGGLIYFCVEKGKWPTDYSLSYADLQTGITLFHVENVVVQQITVQGFQVDGIALANSARNISLISATCRGNGRCGISSGGASSLKLFECLIGDNGTAQLLTMPCSETGIHHSYLLTNTAPGWVDQGGRVYLDGKHVQGGLDKVEPPAQEETNP